MGTRRHRRRILHIHRIRRQATTHTRLLIPRSMDIQALLGIGETAHGPSVSRPADGIGTLGQTVHGISASYSTSERVISEG